MIAVKINDTTHEFEERTSILEMLEKLCIQQQGIALAVNQTIINKHQWDATFLQSNDAVLIIKATQGG